jgi:hypothetical protein
MKRLKAYLITDTRLISSVYDGSEPSKISMKQTYILTNRSLEPALGETVRTLFSIGDYLDLKSGETVEIPLNFMASVQEIPFEVFQRIFKAAGGTIIEKVKKPVEYGVQDVPFWPPPVLPKASPEQIKATENEDRMFI